LLRWPDVPRCRLAVSCPMALRRCRSSFWFGSLASSILPYEARAAHPPVFDGTIKGRVDERRFRAVDRRGLLAVLAPISTPMAARPLPRGLQNRHCRLRFHIACSPKAPHAGNPMREDRAL
jgi:hypothetical protein